MFRPVLVIAALVVVAALPACNQDDDRLVVYSGRNENLVRPILEDFASESGIDIHVRYADTAELLPTLLEEGDATRADVFFSQDAGALGALVLEDMAAELPADVLELVDARFRDPDGRWIGVTGRARVVAYNTEDVPQAELPSSVLDVTDPRWRGRVGYPPTNASFVAFVTALRETIGDDRAREFLEDLRNNDAKRYDNNVQTLDAVASGEVALGLVNHYYLYNEFKERPDAPVANHYPPDAPGTFVNIAGVAILEGTDQEAEAQRFVRFLLDRQAQEYFREETAEYPLRTGIDPIAELPRLAELDTIEVPLTRLGRDLEGTVEMLKEVGIT